MKITLGILVMLLGAFLLLSGSLLAVLVADITPPIISTSIPAVGMVASSFTSLMVDTYDSESGIQSVYCTVDGTSYQLTNVLGPGIPPQPTSMWVGGPSSTTLGTGSHTFAWAITNKAGLVNSLSGSFTIYTGLQGKWYINDVEITSTAQTVYSTSLTVNFKFVKTSGVEDSKITSTVWEGTTKLLTLTNTVANTWTGSYTFIGGSHTLELKAYDGTQTVTMSILALDFGDGGGLIPILPNISPQQIIGFALIPIGYILHKKEIP